MLFDTSATHDAPSPSLPECRPDQYKTVSDFINDKSLFRDARESAMCYSVHTENFSLPAIGFEPMEGFFLGVCPPGPIPHSYETYFACEQPCAIFMLLLEGRCRFGVEGEGSYGPELGKNSFIAADLKGMHGKCSIPALESYSHVTMIVLPDAVKTQFGLRFALDMERILHGRKDSSRHLPALSGPASPDLVSSGCRLLAMPKGDSLDTMGLRSASLDFFTRILRNAASPPPAQSVALSEHDVSALTFLKERIEHNCLEEISIRELCLSIGMSESKGCRSFKQLFHITIARHVHNCKMRYAHDILSSRKRNVSECAFDVGYSSIGHFIAAYRKHYGQTPGNAFRQAL